MENNWQEQREARILQIVKNAKAGKDVIFTNEEWSDEDMWVAYDMGYKAGRRSKK